MKNIRKSVISAGAFALSMAIISMSANVPVAAKGKSDTIKPNPPSVAKGKSATIPVELPTVDAPATERGIKDNGVKSCNGCGMTGRAAAPPPVDTGAAPGTAPQDLRGGSIVIGATPVDPQSADKAGRPKERDDSQSDTSVAERQAPNGQGGTPPSTAKPKKKGPKERDDAVYRTPLRLSLIGGVAGISAVIALAASGGDDKPASP